MTKNKKRKLTLADFFVGYFENIGRLTLVNLLVCVPMAVLVTAFYFLNTAGFLSLFILFLIFPAMSPFFGGLFYICFKVVRGQKFRPIKDFFKGVKENSLYFFLDSLIIYIFGSGFYITFSFYRMGLEGTLMIISFILSVIVLLFFICFQNSVLTMTVSVKLGFPDIIRNSAVLVVTGLFGHFKTLLSISLIAVIMFTINMAAGNAFIILIVAIISTVLFLPVLIAYIIVFNAYQAIEKQIIIPYQEEVEKKNERKANDFSSVTDEDIIELKKLAKGSDDEFVSFRGRMLRRSTVKKIIETHSDMI